MLTRRDALRLGIVLPVGALAPIFAFGSKDFWESKPSSQWNANEIDRLITNSPWARPAEVRYNGDGGGDGGVGGSRRGRVGGGIGFPGGGIGLPGGGGMGYPGGGGGRTGGPMGSPGPAGGGQGDSPRFEGIVRWESASLIQEALSIGVSNGDSKPNTDFENYYVIHIVGDMPGFGGSRGRNGGDSDASAEDSNEGRAEMLRQYTRLERRNGFIRLEKTSEGSRIGAAGPGTFFYFPRNEPLSLDDKSVMFTTRMGPLEIKAKFTLKDMLYKGKLAV